MVCEDGDEKSNNQYNNSILEIIHKDANESFKFFQDNINSINTRLTLLIGFNATFSSLLPRLPMPTVFFIKTQNLQELNNLYPYIKQILEISILIMNWLISIKPLIALFIGTSIIMAILGVIPSSMPIVLLPKKMLEKGKGCSEEDFMIGIIQNRDETIQRLQNLIERKAANLKYALMTLAGAALLTIFDLLVSSNIVCN